jgi:hypothetical protein
VDSSPPPPSLAARTLRPWYLVAAMVLTWIIGVQGLATGFAQIAYLRAGNVVTAETLAPKVDQAEPMQYVAVAGEAARLRALADERRVTFPLSVAKLLLSGLLVAGSGLALAGRPNARSIAMQALLANVALSLLDYGLTRPVRGAWIEAVVEAWSTVPGTIPERAVFQDRDVWWWMWRLRLAILDIGALGLAALALTRRRSAVYFEAAAAAHAHAEGRDDE